jgi:hypothetical protein
LTGDDRRFQSPQWSKPSPLGYAAAADAAHFVAAPLLAAGAVALVGVVAADADKFRVPSVALLVLTSAFITLVGSVQLGFHARALLYSAADIADWWGEYDLSQPQREERLRKEQHNDLGRWRWKIYWAVTTYNLGVSFLAAGVALCLIPPVTHTPSGVAIRWIAFGLVGLATLGELAYGAAKLLSLPRN